METASLTHGEPVGNRGLPRRPIFLSNPSPHTRPRPTPRTPAASPPATISPEVQPPLGPREDGLDREDNPRIRKSIQPARRANRRESDELTAGWPSHCIEAPEPRRAPKKLARKLEISVPVVIMREARGKFRLFNRELLAIVRATSFNHGTTGSLHRKHPPHGSPDGGFYCTNLPRIAESARFTRLGIAIRADLNPSSGRSSTHVPAPVWRLCSSLSRLLCCAFRGPIQALASFAS